MSDLLTRVRVVLSNISTWLVAAAAAIGVFSEEIVELLPDDWQGGWAQGVATALAVIAVTVAIIRRVTPVISAQHGLLPVEGPIVPAANQKGIPA